jgi:hypothetical protein
LAWRKQYSPYATPIHRIHLIWPLVISTCFLQSKKNSNGFSWPTRTSLLNACKRFWGVWINKNWIPYFRLRCAEFKKSMKAMETMSDDKKFMYIKVQPVLIRRRWRMYLSTRR